MYFYFLLIYNINKIVYLTINKVKFINKNIIISLLE